MPLSKKENANNGYWIWKCIRSNTASFHHLCCQTVESFVDPWWLSGYRYIVSDKGWEIGPRWTKHFLSTMRECIPSKTVPIQSYTPWIDHDISRDIKKHECWYHKFKVSKSVEWLSKYKALHNAIVCKIRKANKYTSTILPTLNLTRRSFGHLSGYSDLTPFLHLPPFLMGLQWLILNRTRLDCWTIILHLVLIPSVYHLPFRMIKLSSLQPHPTHLY